MSTLFLLFFVLPAVELALLIELGNRVGTFETILLILVTGALGASLARHQGLRVLRQLEHELRTGQMPASTLLDGAMVLGAAALLITPGILTDAFGLLCLVPATRRPLRTLLQAWLVRRLQRGGGHVDVRFTTARWESAAGPVHDVTPERPGASASGETTAPRPMRKGA